MRLAPNKPERMRMEAESVQAMFHGKTQAWVMNWLEKRYPYLRSLTPAKLDQCMAEAQRLKRSGITCPAGCEWCAQ